MKGAGIGGRETLPEIAAIVMILSGQPLITRALGSCIEISHQNHRKLRPIGTQPLTNDTGGPELGGGVKIKVGVDANKAAPIGMKKAYGGLPGKAASEGSAWDVRSMTEEKMVLPPAGDLSFKEKDVVLPEMGCCGAPPDVVIDS